MKAITMSDKSDTPSARTLAFNLQNAAFATGEDNQMEHVSDVRLNRHDTACREAEKAVIERIETLERELTQMTSERDRCRKLLCLAVSCFDADDRWKHLTSDIRKELYGCN